MAGIPPILSARDRSPGAQQARAGEPIAVARGIGGRVELHRGTLRIVKDGVLANLLEIIGIEGALMETTIRLDLLSGFKVIEPLVLPQFIVFSYPGSPTFSGSYLHDAFGENAVLMNIGDNRPFVRLIHRLEDILDRRGEAGEPFAG